MVLLLLLSTSRLPGAPSRELLYVASACRVAMGQTGGTQGTLGQGALCGVQEDTVWYTTLDGRVTLPYNTVYTD